MPGCAVTGNKTRTFLVHCKSARLLQYITELPTVMYSVSKGSAADMPGCQGGQSKAGETPGSSN